MRKEYPLFTVIVPNYNRQNLLIDAVKSVCAQTYQNWELWIIEDGSPNTVENLVAKISDTRVNYIYQEHKGRSAARNLGIEKAKGSFICFLDDDDQFLPGHLENFFDHLNQNNFQKEIIRSGFLIENNGKRERSVNYDPEKHKNPVRFATYQMCGIWSLCIPVSFLKDNQFPENFPYWQDTHLILRLLAKYPFRQLDSYSYVYRIHGGMGSKNILQYKDWMMRIELNVQAIQHLFQTHAEQLGTYLKEDTESFLVSEKYLSYANQLMASSRIRQGLKVYKKVEIFSHLWRSHLRFWFLFLMAAFKKAGHALRIIQKDWTDIEYFDPAWDERVSIMAGLIPESCTTIMDLGCGTQKLRDLLHKSQFYIPVDLVSRSPDTRVCDFNKKQFPDQKCDLTFASGVLEYVHNPEWIIRKISDSSIYCLLSYCTLDSYPEMKMRKLHNWQNHLTRESLIELFSKNRMESIEERRLNYSIFLFRKNPGPESQPVNKWEKT